MTACYELPKPTSQRFRFRSKPVNARAIKAVVPTYKDWDGLRVTLDSLLGLKTPPQSIAVANDNLEKDVPSWLSDYPVDLVEYEGNLGPAKARNKGFGLKGEYPPTTILALGRVFEGKPLPDFLKHGFCEALKFSAYTANPQLFTWDSPFDWCYFTDCSCHHDPELFLKFEETWRECGDCCVAISGPVTGTGPGVVNDYMTEQGILNPPKERNIHGAYIPQAIITANALVAALPFAFLGGFDPKFQEAAGEDLDLGIRLRQLGVIAWSAEAKVSHRFDESETDFSNRFRRYGRGCRQLEVKHGLPCLRAKPFTAEKPDLQRLADLSVAAMQAGYDEAIDQAAQGVLQILPD